MNELLPDHEIIAGHRLATGVHGEGEPLVLVHGTPSHAFIWRNVVPGLVAAGYRVHLFDLLGFGASERPRAADTSVAGQEALVAELLRTWQLESAHFVCHDIGGAIGLRLAVHAPQLLRSLVLIDTVSYDSWPSPTWRRIIDEHFEAYRGMPADEFRALMTRQLQMTVHDRAVMTGEVLERYLEPLSGPLGQVSFFEHQMRHYDARYTGEVTSELGAIDLPVAILWGAEDEWQPVHYARRLHADIPGAVLEIVPQAGHFLMEDAPEAVTRHLVGFLAGIDTVKR